MDVNWVHFQGVYKGSVGISQDLGFRLSDVGFTGLSRSELAGWGPNRQVCNVSKTWIATGYCIVEASISSTSLSEA